MATNRIHPPGSIAGAPFALENLGAEAHVALLDHCDQVTVDECDSSTVVIGPSSTVFLRDCRGCTFHVAANQIRLRDVTDCRIFAVPPLPLPLPCH